MAAKQIIGGVKGLGEAVLKLALAVNEGKDKKTKLMGHIANRKFDEIEKSHKEIVILLGRLSKAAIVIDKKIKRSKSDPRLLFWQALGKVGDARAQGMEGRRKIYEEARIYAEKKLDDPGIFNSIDPQVADKLKELMECCVRYFRTDNEYMHALGYALEKVRSSMVVPRIVDSPSRLSDENMDRSAKEVHEVAEQAILEARKRWIDVVVKYNEFKFVLLERGVEID
jgi:hypothetical protein